MNRLRNHPRSVWYLCVLATVDFVLIMLQAARVI